MRGGQVETVTLASDGFESVGVVAEFFSEPPDVGVHSPSVGTGSIAPNIL
jgi:hypothetical protein